MISVGEQINTNFTVKAVHEGQEQEVLFSALLTKPTIVSVYMKNNTSSCDRQTASLAEHAPWFAEQGYQLMALSKDTCGSHKKYAEKQGITFSLVSDPENLFAVATDSMVEKKMYGKVYEAPSRSAFVIDTDGTILAVIDKVDTKAHAEELKTLIQSL
jgi:peroxiredoxin Q/BCP